jgi:hypothetical protein
VGHRDRMVGGSGVAHRLHSASRTRRATGDSVVPRPQNGQRPQASGAGRWLARVA